MNGRNAGRKAIIIRTSHEKTKDKKFPHCLVVGLSKTPRRVTKASLKKLEEKVKRIEGSGDSKIVKNSNSAEVVAERLARLKRTGVFIKTYNMAHLLATRYKVEDEFGFENQIKKLDVLEEDLRKSQEALNKAEEEKKEKNVIDDLTGKVENLRKLYKDTFRSAKNSIGSELFSRYVKGFVRTKDNAAENEKIAHSEFLFKKLKF